MTCCTYPANSSKSIFSAFTAILLTSVLASCGGDQAPSFKTVDAGKKVRLHIEDDASLAVDSTSANSQIGDEEAGNILEGLYPDEEVSTTSSDSESPNSRRSSSDAVAANASDSDETLNWDETENDSENSSNTNSSSNDDDSTSETASDSDITSGELKACAAINNIDAKYIHVIGNSNQNSIKLNSVLAIKVSGNGGELELELDLVGRGGSDSIQGVCLFVTGNQGHASIKITDLRVDKLTYIGRGNQSSTDVTITSNAELGNIIASLSGNRSELIIEGEGNYNCGTASVKGNSGKYICQ